MVFDGSKQILNSSLASLIAMSLHQAFGSDFWHVFPLNFILSNCSFISDTRSYKISAVGIFSEASGWRFESVPVPCDVPRQWTSSAGILASASFAQSELKR